MSQLAETNIDYILIADSLKEASDKFQRRILANYLSGKQFTKPAVKTGLYEFAFIFKGETKVKRGIGKFDSNTGKIDFMNNQKMQVGEDLLYLEVI